jgi:parallel beta-helix repeat protein
MEDTENQTQQTPDQGTQQEGQTEPAASTAPAAPEQKPEENTGTEAEQPSQETTPPSEEAPKPTSESPTPQPQAEAQPTSETPTPQPQAEAQPAAEEPTPPLETEAPPATEQQSTEFSFSSYKTGMGISRTKILILLIAVIAIAAVAFVVLTGKVSLPTTTTTSTIIKSNVNIIAGCETISKPGTYVLGNDINANLMQGACIKIVSDNVNLVGNQNKIIGSGPYSGVPPFTYGIELQNVSNVSISSFFITKFSYDVFFNNTHKTLLLSNNFTNSTLSGILLSNSDNNTISKDYVAGSESKEGGIYLLSGEGNKFLNDTIIRNAFYGIVVNSTNNTFENDIFSSNPADILCNFSSAFKHSNIFNNSKCSVNDYCEFATCTSNVPFNISSIRLSPGMVDSCGSIYIPGSYTLAENLSTSTYLNVSNPLAAETSCIKILAPNVDLNCNGKQIFDSGYGVYLYSAYNVSLLNCSFSKDTYGVYASEAFNPQFVNTTLAKNIYGIYLLNTSTGKISNTNLLGNEYGLYLNNSNGVLFYNINSNNNTYGIYIDSGDSNVFNGGKSLNNTKADFYCSSTAYNSTTNLVQDFQCGVSDCMWSSCTRIVPHPELAYPVGSCMKISYPGDYSLKQNVIASGTCFTIASSNVVFDCNAHTISGAFTGNAIEMSNVDNVTVSNCIVSNFATGVNVTDSRLVELAQMKVNRTSTGISLSNILLGTIINDYVSGQNSTGFLMKGLNRTVVFKNTANEGAGQESGFIFDNSTQSQIYFNNATSNTGYGFRFVNSRGNNIFNNSALSNGVFDYSCFGNSSDIYAEPIGVNFGLSKDNCNWLVEVDSLITGPQCAAIFSPTELDFNRDLLYSIGSTCFSIYTANFSSANGTIINCNGHTIYSDNGGKFVDVVNASGVEVENCRILGFDTAIATSALGTSVLNNTITKVKYGITMNGSKFPSISDNRIENSSNGILAINSTFVNVAENRMYNVSHGINMTDSSSPDVYNNTLSQGATGLSFLNTSLATLKDNSFLNMSSYDIGCFGISAKASGSALDEGGNICSMGVAKSSMGVTNHGPLNIDCSWITSPNCI